MSVHTQNITEDKHKHVRDQGWLTGCGHKENDDDDDGDGDGKDDDGDQGQILHGIGQTPM